MKVKILKDSINSATNERLTTFLLTFPRFINAEILRHRSFSFLSSSNRATPLKKTIELLKQSPAIPIFWGKNQSGMQAKEEIDEESKQKAIDEWFVGRDKAIETALKLDNLGLHKQIVNRVLEPFQNITLMVSGTDWENFFALRAHPDAQPEIQALAYEMLEKYNNNLPNPVKPANCLRLGIIEALMGGDHAKYEQFVEQNYESFHIPFEDKMPEGLKPIEKIKVAIARCARLSYLTFDGEINVEKDLALYNKLLNTNPKHASPAEMVAFAVSFRDRERHGRSNYHGWCQFRKLLPCETSTDSRVIRREYQEDGSVV